MGFVNRERQDRDMRIRYFLDIVETDAAMLLALYASAAQLGPRGKVQASCVHLLYLRAGSAGLTRVQYA